jgi:hypothetical protein
MDGQHRCFPAYGGGRAELRQRACLWEVNTSSDPVMNNTAYLPAVPALAGSAVGGLTSLASAWLTQRHQDPAKLLLQDKGRRQSLYKQFINEASKLYADALSNDKSDISALVSV